MNKNFSLALLLLSLIYLIPAYAGDYEVNVTRKGSNLYKVTGKDIYILTNYCYEYVYYSDAILKMMGYTGEIYFLEEKQVCDVKAVYGITDIKAGKYKVTISREADDWYEIFGMNLFIHTSSCLSLALVENAILEIRRGSIGTIYFKDGTECMVDGIYNRLSL